MGAARRQKANDLRQGVSWSARSIRRACARPRRPAIPLSAAAPRARSICPAATGPASGRSSQDATSEVRPADLNVSRKPLRPPGELEIVARISLTSDRALAPEARTGWPNRRSACRTLPCLSSPGVPSPVQALQKTMTARWHPKPPSRSRLRFAEALPRLNP